MFFFRRALLVNSEDDKTGDVTRFYETGAHGAVSRSLLPMTRDTNARDLYDVIDEYRMNLPLGKKPLWMVSDWLNLQGTAAAWHFVILCCS